ncbi:hypothetical protein FF2_046200 [Malus domestica]
MPSPPIVTNCFLNVSAHPNGELKTTHGIGWQGHGQRLNKDLYQLGIETVQPNPSFELRACLEHSQKQPSWNVRNQPRAQDTSQTPHCTECPELLQYSS